MVTAQELVMLLAGGTDAAASDANRADDSGGRSMKNSLTALGLAAFALLATASVAEAKCFGFRGLDIKVCVDGDDNAARRAATAVCEDVTGGSCSIAGYSGECRRSSSVRCYDAAGDEQRSIESD